MIAAMASTAPTTLVHLSAVDLGIIAFYFALVLGIGFYLKRFAKTGEDFFLAGRDDRVGGGAGLCFGQPWFPGAARLGRFGLPIRHSRRALVLDWRHSGDGVSGHRDDAFLLHFKDAFRSRLFAIALWFGDERT